MRLTLDWDEAWRDVPVQFVDDDGTEILLAVIEDVPLDMMAGQVIEVELSSVRAVCTCTGMRYPNFVLWYRFAPAIVDTGPHHMVENIQPTER